MEEEKDVRKRIFIALASIAAVLAAFAVFFLTRPSVAILEPEYPEGYDLISPAILTSAYRTVSRAEGADAVIALPGAELPEGTDGVAIGSEELSIDESSMWKAALGDGRECILYESSDSAARSIAESLLASDDNAYAVTYDGRISVENINRILSEVSGSDSLLMLTPSTSVRLIRENDAGTSVVMDYRDAAAMDTTIVNKAVCINWDTFIRSVLDGSPELSYTLIPLHE